MYGGFILECTRDEIAPNKNKGGRTSRSLFTVILAPHHRSTSLIYYQKMVSLRVFLASLMVVAVVHDAVAVPSEARLLFRTATATCIKKGDAVSII